MKRLIKSEFYKIGKGRKLWVFVLITCLLTLFLCFRNYYGNDSFKEMGYEFKDLNGESISDFTMMKKADQVLHQYAGEWNHKIEDKIISDLNKELQKYPRDQLDTKKMQEEYGKDWKLYIEKEETVGLTNEDIQSLEQELGYSPNITDENGKRELFKFYSNDPQREYLSYLYTGELYSHKYSKIENNVFREWNAYLLNPTLENVKKESFNIGSMYTNEKFNSKQIKVFDDYVMEEVSNLNKVFDSGIPNQLLLSTLSHVYILPLFVIMILLSNLFSIEKECHTDQIIYPTATSKHKITIAKLISGYLFAGGLMLLQFVIVYLFSLIVFPVHSWDLIVTSNFISVNPIVPTTYLTLLIYAIVLPIFAALSISTLTMLLSYIFEKKFVVIIILFVFMAMGYFMSILNIESIWNIMFRFFHPLNMSMFDLYFAEGYIYVIGNPYLVSESMVFAMRWLVMGGGSLFIIFISFILSKCSYKHFIRF